jgi:hypothetical protein
MNKLEILNDIVTYCSARKVKSNSKKILLDVSTAKVILLVYNAIKKEEIKQKYLDLDWLRMANFAWSKIK